MRPLVALLLILSISACANSPTNRFKSFQDQLTSNTRIDVVLDSFGVNDIEGEHPGFNLDKNLKLSKNLQKEVLSVLKQKGYKPTVLQATMGVHMQEYINGKKIFYAKGNKPTDQQWDGPPLTEANEAWGEESVIKYVETAFIEAELANRKNENKALTFLANSVKTTQYKNKPKYQHLPNTPEAAAQRSAVLQNMPAVLAESTADTLLVVKVAGYEVNRAKSALATATLAGITNQLSSGTSTGIWTYNSTSPMNAVAIDKRTGKVIWTGFVRGFRYSGSPSFVKDLLALYPKAGS